MNNRFLLVAALAAFAAPAFAMPVTVNVNPGAAIPLGAVGDVTKTSFMIQGSAETPITKDLSGGVEIGYLNPKFEGSFKTATFTSDVNLTVWQATPFVRYSLAAQQVAGKSVTPYGLLGAGVYVDKANSGTITFSDGSTVPDPGKTSVVHFGFNIGIGASMDVATNVAVGVDLRYHMYFTKLDINQDGKGSDPVNFFVPSLRVSYKFGS
jgi:opacity protein-like surface antigen